MTKRIMGSLNKLYHIIQRILSEEFDSLIGIVIFGSCARGDFSKNSDLDLLLVFKGLELSSFKRTKLVYPILKKIENDPFFRLLENDIPNLHLSPVIINDREFSSRPPILLDIVIEGKIVYDPHDIVKNEFRIVKKRLQELGAFRTPNSWRGFLWQLKKDFKVGEEIKI